LFLAERGTNTAGAAVTHPSPISISEKNTGMPSNNSLTPTDYGATLKAIKLRVQQERVHVVLSANTSMVLLYWDIGSLILERQTREGWGAKVIDRLARDLRKGFPDMKGFSSRNLLFMRRFAEEFPEASIVKQLVSLLPWGHAIRLMQRVKEPDVREWYMRESVRQGWSRSVLEIQLLGNAHRRQGKAVTNFASALPIAESQRAAEVFKDPYLFDFLGTTDLNRERQVEQALVDHIQRFMLELGSGFAFVGRQVQLSVGDEDFYLDLLFYHLKLRCYVVIELKAVPFDATFVGQINLYLSAVDDQFRHSEDRPTIGLLLCRSKHQVVVEYALRDLKKPVGVAGWETTLSKALPEGYFGSLPTVEELEAELGGGEAEG
jgi:predicted nuclease of restriction endonuclease-like (RecB) superfamily